MCNLFVTLFHACQLQERCTVLSTSSNPLPFSCSRATVSERHLISTSCSRQITEIFLNYVAAYSRETNLSCLINLQHNQWLLIYFIECQCDTWHQFYSVSMLISQTHDEFRDRRQPYRSWSISLDPYFDLIYFMRGKAASQNYHSTLAQ